MRAYDEPALIRRLAVLSPPGVLVFAACCAERLVPAYQAFHAQTDRGDWRRVRSVLDELWSRVGQDADREWIQRVAAEVESLVPDENQWMGEWPLAATLAGKAACALHYALRCGLDNDPQEAAWSVRMGIESLFHLVCETCGPIPTSHGPASVRWAEEHPLMQAELERLERDLLEIESAVQEDVPALVTRLRTRAQSESGTMFGSPR